MRNYEEMKKRLMDIGFADWQIYSPELFDRLNNANKERPCELLVCGAFSVIKDFVKKLSPTYYYEEIDENLCGINGNRIGLVCSLTITCYVRIEAFVIADNQLFMEISDENYEIQAYVKMTNRGF